MSESALNQATGPTSSDADGQPPLRMQARLQINVFTVALPLPLHITAVHPAAMLDSTSGAAAYAFGSLFNHSCVPNVDVAWGRGDAVVAFTACQEVQPGEQLTVRLRVVLAVRWRTLCSTLFRMCSTQDSSGAAHSLVHGCGELSHVIVWVARMCLHLWCYQLSRILCAHLVDSHLGNWPVRMSRLCDEGFYARPFTLLRRDLVFASFAGWQFCCSHSTTRAKQRTAMPLVQWPRAAVTAGELHR